MENLNPFLIKLILNKFQVKFIEINIFFSD